MCPPMTDLTSITAKRSRVAWPLVRCSAWKSPDQAITAINLQRSYNPLSITAIDWTLQRGPFEIIGEAAWAYARGNSRAIPGNQIGFAPGSLLTGIGGNSGPGIPPQRMKGFYIQGNYHFMPAFLTKLSPKRFGEGSTFTAVIRYDRVNTNLDNTQWDRRLGQSGADFLWPQLSAH